MASYVLAAARCLTVCSTMQRVEAEEREDEVESVAYTTVDTEIAQLVNFLVRNAKSCTTAGALAPRLSSLAEHEHNHSCSKGKYCVEAPSYDSVACSRSLCQAENSHDTWAEQRMSEGWTHGDDYNAAQQTR